MTDPLRGTLFCAAVTPAGIREHCGDDRAGGRYFVVLGRVVGTEMTERLTLVVDSQDQVRDLIAMLMPGYVDASVGPNEDRDEILASLLRPRPPGSLVDLEAVKHEADRAIQRMIKRGDAGDGK